MDRAVLGLVFHILVIELQRAQRVGFLQLGRVLQQAPHACWFLQFAQRLAGVRSQREQKLAAVGLELGGAVAGQNMAVALVEFKRRQRATLVDNSAEAIEALLEGQDATAAW